MPIAPETQLPKQAMTPSEARWHRAHVGAVATRLDAIWLNAPGLPEFAWDELSALPAWVLADSRQLKRLALLTGALYAAPALRLCLDAAPLQRMRKLLGATAFDLVLATPSLPMDGSAWPVDAQAKGTEIYALSAALLLAGVENKLARATLARMLGLSHDCANPPLVEPELARRVVTRAVEIAQELDRAAEAREKVAP